MFDRGGATANPGALLGHAVQGDGLVGPAPPLHPQFNAWASPCRGAPWPACAARQVPGLCLTHRAEIPKQPLSRWVSGLTPTGPEGSEQDRKMRELLEELRLDKGKRRVSAGLLEEVADVYRANIDHAPTEAVARTFGVRSRMASNYVQRARERGFLPPTKQGKKQA